MTFNHFTYLLQCRPTRYPRYICQSPLSLAFAKNESITLEVHLSQFRQLFIQQKVQFQGIYPKFEIVVKLVSSADETIKNIIRTIYSKYALKISSGKSSFLMQVKGYREFIGGPEPMLAFERVRQILRGHPFLMVVLVEADLEENKKNQFPPTVYRRLDDIKDNVIPEIQWDQYQEVPILMWYPPHELPQYEPSNPKCFIDDFEVKQKALKFLVSSASDWKKENHQLNEPLQFRVAIKENIDQIVKKKRSQVVNVIFHLVQYQKEQKTYFKSLNNLILN